jgi:hypothetical protein
VRLAGLAGERGPARLRARLWADHRPHPDHRIARTRPARPAQNRRPRPLDAPVRPVERQKLHRRREVASARRPLHGRALVAVRHNSALKGFHQRLLDAVKPKLVAIVAAAQKLSSPLSTLLSESKNHGSPLDGKDNRSPLWGDLGGARRPRRRASDGAFDNLHGPRDPPPLLAPTRGAGAQMLGFYPTAARL